MTRTLFATVLSAALALGAMAPAPAQADNDNLKKLLGGIATVVILGATYDHLRDKSKRDDQGRHSGRYDDRHPRYDSGRGSHGGSGHPGRHRIVPAQCLHQVSTRHGTERFYGKRCLERSMRAAHQLPRTCEIRVRTREGSFFGYAPRCLSEHGWRRG